MTGPRTRLLATLAVLTLAGCASGQRNTGNSCAIFEQRSGFFTNWRRDAERVSAEFGVPVPVLMATIQAESNFEASARPPRRWFLGFIPAGRVSSAYGYAQALDGTWDEYRRATGRPRARRDDFADAIHFIGWFHARSSRINAIGRGDAYRLYLAYHSGHAGFARDVWRSRPEALRGARRAATMAARYEAQMRRC